MSSLFISTIVVTPFQQNARIVSREGRGVVIDPGGDAGAIFARVRGLGIVVEEIWLTHSHLDHCGGVAPLLELLSGAQLPQPLVRAHREEEFFRSRVEEIAAMYGVPRGVFVNCPEPDEGIAGGETLSGEWGTWRVLFTPGHSPGHVSFYNEEEGLLIGGDTIFGGSWGRTDLPGGDGAVLLETIKRLLALPPETRVLAGHGSDTTVGREQLLVEALRRTI